MKKGYLLLTLFMSASCLITSHATLAQTTELTEAENERVDSLKVLYDAEEKHLQNKEDEESLSELNAQKSDSKMKAKEAKRIERDANNAARESSNAYRSEKKAQKSREQADKQAKKAAKARSVSDEN